MRRKLKSQSASKALSRPELFGPPPILEGENAKDYYELLERVFSAIGPTDFIEEIWARDLTDVVWSMFRWRRILAALLDDDVWDKVNNKASERAEQEAKLLELPEKEKEEMDKLLDTSDLTWEESMAKYPRANDKFQVLWSKAKADLNVDLIQARVITNNLDKIERIECLIAIAQRRIDEVIREFDRHRLIRAQLNKCSVIDEPASVLQPKMITGKVINKKVA
jgi:hypothetical protein